MVKAKSTLSDWNKMVEALHSKYKWLLFFRVPKLMQVCKYLHTESIQNIYQEIQFLFEWNSSNRPKKQSVIKDIKVILFYCL